MNDGLPEDEQVNIFPYTLHYVYYEQYLTMWEDTGFLLGVSMAAIVSVTFVFAGFSIRSTAVITIVIIMVLVNLMGMMYWWEIQVRFKYLPTILIRAH